MCMHIYMYERGRALIACRAPYQAGERGRGHLNGTCRRHYLALLPLQVTGKDAFVGTPPPPLCS